MLSMKTSIRAMLDMVEPVSNCNMYATLVAEDEVDAAIEKAKSTWENAVQQAERDRE